MARQDDDVDVSRRQLGSLLGALGGLTGLGALAGCTAQPLPGSAESMGASRQAITGTGLTFGPFVMEGPQPAPTTRIVLSVGSTPPLQLAGRTWVAIEPYSANCEVCAVTGINRNEIDVWPPTAIDHPSGALVVFLEEGVVTPQLFGFQRGADATPAIHAAIAALTKLTTGAPDGGTCSYQAATGACENGGTLYLPRGVYPTFDIALPEHINIRGDGVSSVLGYKGTGTAILWTPSLFQAGIGAVLSGFQLRSENSQSQIGIQIRSGFVATIRDVTVSVESGVGGFLNCGIQILSIGGEDSAIVNVLESSVNGVGGDGVQVKSSLPTVADYIINIRGNHIQGNGGFGVNVNGGTPNPNGQIAPSQVKIDGNDLEGNTLGGITGSFYASSITNNYWEDARGNAFIVVNEGPGGTLQAIYGLEVANNVIHMGGSAPYPCAIDLRPSSGGLAVSVHNNYLALPGGTVAGIKLAGCRQSSVRDNWVSLGPSQGALYSDYYESNDYNLAKRVYRFVMRKVPPGLGLFPIDTEGVTAGRNYRMPSVGQVLAINAYYSNPIVPAAGKHIQVQAVTTAPPGCATTTGCGEGVHLDTGISSLPDPNTRLLSVTTPVVQVTKVSPGPVQFAAGSSLQALVSLSLDPGEADGDLIVEIVVGLGNAGGGVN
jgi:hypothetical protein